MGRFSKVQRDKNRRRSFFLKEKAIRVAKSRYVDQRVSITDRLSIFSDLSFNTTPFLSRVKNRCVRTGKSRSILSKFGFSQTTLRFFARSGLITGIKKASW